MSILDKMLDKAIEWTDSVLGDDFYLQPAGHPAPKDDPYLAMIVMILILVALCGGVSYCVSSQWK